MQITSSLLTMASSVITLVGFGYTLLRWNGWLAVLVLLSALPTLYAQVWLARRRSEMIVRTSPYCCGGRRSIPPCCSTSAPRRRSGCSGWRLLPYAP